MKRLWIYCIVLLLASACEDPFKDSTYQVYDVNPISAYLNSQPEKYSEWVSLLKYADLYNALSMTDAQFTALAPNNEAVKNYMKNNNIASWDDTGVEFARQLVKFHTLKGAIDKSTFNQGGKLSTPTITGEYLVVSFEDGGVPAINKEARVVDISRDSVISNGYVYTLDAVMSPLVETVYQRLEQNPDYSLFLEAAQKTGWDKALSTTADTTYDVDGSQIVARKYYTLLAVSNEAFARSQITDFNSLVAKLGADSDYTSASNALYQYLGFHIISGSVYQDEFYKMPEGGNIGTWSTNADNQVLQIIQAPGNEYQFGFDVATKNFARLLATKSDLVAVNGILHELDYYMPIGQPQTALVIWEFTDYPDIASYINEQTAEHYRSPYDVEKKIALNIPQISSYTYKAKEGLTNKDASILYYLPDSTSKAVKPSLKDDGMHNLSGLAMNGDWLQVNLGYMGWIQMQSPTIIKGKYKVILGVVYRAGKLKSLRNHYVKFSVDGKNVVEMMPYPSTVFDNKTTGTVGEVVIWDEIEFDGTGTHALKMVVTNAQADTFKDYCFWLDYVRFVPID